MGERRGEYGDMVWRRDGKILLGRHGGNRDDNITMDLQEMG
jgi:hypothetical protein